MPKFIWLRSLHRNQPSNPVNNVRLADSCELMNSSALSFWELQCELPDNLSPAKGNLEVRYLSLAKPVVHRALTTQRNQDQSMQRRRTNQIGLSHSDCSSLTSWLGTRWQPTKRRAVVISVVMMSVLPMPSMLSKSAVSDFANEACRFAWTVLRVLLFSNLTSSSCCACLARIAPKVHQLALNFQCELKLVGYHALSEILPALCCLLAIDCGRLGYICPTEASQSHQLPWGHSALHMQKRESKRSPWPLRILKWITARVDP